MELICCATLEWLNSQNTISRKAVYKTATLRLVRNEFRELLLDLRSDKVSFRYGLRGVAVRNRFMSEGKASMTFSEHNMMLLLSNAPPVQLQAFLRTAFVKLSESNGGPKPDPRTRLLSEKSNALEEISPVTLQELSKAKRRAGCSDSTPPGPKRKVQETHRSGKKLCLPTAGALTSEQKAVLDGALAGKNIFFTGSAGTGKSYLLRRVIGALPPDVTVATASTGVAACHIGGVTLHSFAGIGSGKASLERCIELASRPLVQQSWRRCRHLIIDEISMVDGLFFEKLEHVARVVRGNDRPFGGVQLILCGDFLQLPPVTRETEQKNNIRFCFQSAAWERCVHSSFELTQVHRQSDPEFIDILQNIRIGRVTPEITSQLLATKIHSVEAAGILATRLCSHMQDADLINTSKLNQLTGDSKKFEAVDSDPYSTKTLDQMTPVPSSLVLKVGAQVMLMKNINVSEGLVNGARGVVTKFDDKGLPVVRFCTKKEMMLQPERWTIKTGGGALLSRKQIPVRLAWAFSIHKSQGLTLDCVEMSLARVFEAGQAYVALSRAKSLKTLRILDFDPKQVWANPDVLSFYKKFRRRMHQMQIIPLGKSKH
ncbi:ATP-dependent DNA helicase PIF1 [Periplaneta americana]|uniref:ATP-dependent DNA helicase PIF1 n=1 Tax=Periplaneta americana TaxID=6978 RepID=UPI0037E8EA26